MKFVLIVFISFLVLVTSVEEFAEEELDQSLSAYDTEEELVDIDPEEELIDFDPEEEVDGPLKSLARLKKDVGDQENIVAREIHKLEREQLTNDRRNPKSQNPVREQLGRFVKSLLKNELKDLKQVEMKEGQEMKIAERILHDYENMNPKGSKTHHEKQSKDLLDEIEKEEQELNLDTSQDENGQVVKLQHSAPKVVQDMGAVAITQESVLHSWGFDNNMFFWGMMVPIILLIIYTIFKYFRQKCLESHVDMLKYTEVKETLMKDSDYGGTDHKSLKSRTSGSSITSKLP